MREILKVFGSTSLGAATGAVEEASGFAAGAGTDWTAPAVDTAFLDPGTRSWISFPTDTTGGTTLVSIPSCGGGFIASGEAIRTSFTTPGVGSGFLAMI
jgi:hypothetical protein